jgi:Raf kinase inhibitor-like YbhB/YbcL family protein
MAGRRSYRRAVFRLAVLAAMLSLLSGCGVLGGLSGSGIGAPAPITVMSPDFGTNTPLPVQYTCHGAGLSPPLLWSSGLGQKPKSFAIVVDDGEAPITPFVYWIVFDISPDTSAIAQNQLPTGARVALNSKGTASYFPPCPDGDSGHTYRFTVYALNTWLKNLPRTGAGLRETWTAIARHVIGEGRLTAQAKS